VDIKNVTVRTSLLIMLIVNNSDYFSFCPQFAQNLSVLTVSFPQFVQKRPLPFSALVIVPDFLNMKAITTASMIKTVNGCQ
jgi:hypothetical protein